LIVAHSLGGIAAIEMMMQTPEGMTDQVVTIGTQVGLLQEMGALNRIAGDNNSTFPWLNIFDRSDYLSYLVNPFWSNAVDCEVSSGLPFPESHSAYFSNPDVWARIRNFIDS
jgi:pimeloyl-ACP methyl ester carboxylesterase